MASQLWATPDTGETPNGHGRLGGRADNGHQSGASLEAQAEQMALPPESLWATPAVPNGGRTSNTSNYREDGSKRQVDLAAQADLWATPTTPAPHDSEESVGRGQLSEQTEALWSTPTANPEAPNLNCNQKNKPGSLAIQAQEATPMVSAWPTPSAFDGERPEETMEEWAKRNERKKAENKNLGALHLPLTTAVSAFPSSLPDPAIAPPGAESSPPDPTLRPRLRLNAAFVEWMMGWPLGWTSLAPTACGPAATASWRSRLRRRLSSFTDG